MAILYWFHPQMLECGAASFRVEYLMIKYESPPHVFDNDQKQNVGLNLLEGRNNNYLVSSTFGVDKHKQRLHKLRGKRLHQKGLPAAILKL